MFKSILCKWHLNHIRCVHIVNRLYTIGTTNLDQQDSKLLTKEKARTLLMNMTIEERDNLAWCLNHLESEETKAEYQGSLVQYSHKLRLKLFALFFFFAIYLTFNK